jgi:hypothetical protein
VDRRIAGFAAVLVVGYVMCVPVSAHGADTDRGRALYEARCDLCHGSSVHVRESRKAISFEGVRAQVARWNGELGAGWSADDINDVTVYLNSRYYFFRCPESVCGRGQAGNESGPNLARSRVEGK